MSVIAVRTLNQAGGLWDPQRGQSLSNFLYDIDAVTQIIAQRLKLFAGEVWYNKSLGVPMFQQIIGVPNTTQGVALLLRQQILGTPFVTDVQDLVVNYTGGTRAYTFSCSVLTSFGTITINNQPLPGSSAVIT